VVNVADGAIARLELRLEVIAGRRQRGDPAVLTHTGDSTPIAGSRWLFRG
jgi:hypothetical protein